MATISATLFSALDGVVDPGVGDWHFPYFDEEMGEAVGRIDGYTIGAIPDLEPGPGPHAGEVHPDGDELLYVARGTMELILDDGDERAVGDETRVVLQSGDACVVPRGV